MQGRVAASGSLPAAKAAERAAHNYNKKDEEAGRYVFSAEEFQRMMTKYHHDHLQIRMNNLIVNHSQHHDNKCSFYLYWWDSKLHCHGLKATLTLSEPFSSRFSNFFSDSSLPAFSAKHFNHTLKSGDACYRLDVEEIPSPYPEDPNNKLLTMWFTLDGLLGELREVRAGAKLSGKEVMRIFHYFNHFLQIKNLFIYDDAALENYQDKLPLRLITAITNGQTWFEKQIPGLRLFDSSHLPVKDFITIRQHSQERMQCLRELQTLPLRKWYGMMNVDQKNVLEALHKKYFPPKKEKSSYRLFKSNAVEKDKTEMFGDDTLQMLAMAVRDDAKEQKKISRELLQLNTLLCGNIMFEFGHALSAGSKKTADYWVKSRVQKLLWESLIWILQQPEKEKESEPLIKYGSFSL